MKDLFEYPELLPASVTQIIERFADDVHSYERCDELISELNAVGYTCEYGLDATPYNLQRIHSPKKYGYEDMAHLAFALHFL